MVDRDITFPHSLNGHSAAGVCTNVSAPLQMGGTRPITSLASAFQSRPWPYRFHGGRPPVPKAKVSLLEFRQESGRSNSRRMRSSSVTRCLISAIVAMHGTMTPSHCRSHQPSGPLPSGACGELHRRTKPYAGPKYSSIELFNADGQFASSFSWLCIFWPGRQVAVVSRFSHSAGAHEIHAFPGCEETALCKHKKALVPMKNDECMRYRLAENVQSR
jgi:hypothetical protein